VKIRLVATGKVKGTRLKAGSLLARTSVTLRDGKAVVRLLAKSAAAKALKNGKVRKARLVVTTRDGRKDVRTVTIRR
jgi:VCBS repeat-containing protein